MTEIQPHEQELIGRWIFREGRILADAVAERINVLIAGPLAKVASSEDGWTSLYLDRRDARLWELTYPESEMHGGGPPSLTHISVADAQQRYDYRPDR